MAIFPVLETESIVQEKDKTRLDGTKSFVSDGAAISLVRIKPSDSDSFITVTSTKYLDWQYSFTFDIGATNNKLNFKESGSELTATVASTNYTLSTLAAAVKTAMDAVGTQTYTVSVSGNVITISAATAFSLLVGTGTSASTSIFSTIGFTEDDLAGLTTYSGDEVEVAVKTISIEVTQPSVSPVTITKTIEVISESADRLYSLDSVLKLHESDILKYISPGRSTFKNIHRRAQAMILAWLDKEGYVDVFGNKFTKAALVNIDEVSEWSTFLVLRLIFESLSNAIDDIFDKKSKTYKGLEVENRNRAVIRLDIDGDGVVNLGEDLDVRNGIVVRR